MNIKIKFTNLDKSSAVEDYVFKKLLPLKKFLKGQNDVLTEVELAKTTDHHKSGDIFKAEINITYLNEQFYVVAEKDNLYVAIDQARDEAERAIVSGRKKYLSVFRRGAGKIKNLIRKLG
jgi:ribosomal subunit interface protein